jgi:hypothetical protein
MGRYQSEVLMKNGEYTMIVQNFRKKPVVIQAVQLTNDNVLEAFRWCDAMEWSTDPAELKIKTLEGVMTASEGDYIICGVSGEFYPCKPDIFAKTYDVGPDTAVLAESERDALRTRAEVAEGQRDQAKMRVKAAEEDRIIYLARWDELLNVYDAAKAWAEVTDPPRTDNYREYREASQRLLDVVARTFFESRRPTVTYTGEDTRTRCS